MAALSRVAEAPATVSRGTTRLSAHASPLAAAGLIALAAVIRVALLHAGWPGTDSDDSTMGLMAKHILQRGEHPSFFYGQAYMGTIEAYLGALFMAVFGVSSFALKLGLVALYCAFLAVMYALLTRAFEQRWALVALGLLALGSDNMLYHQLEAYGGYLETLLFGALMLLLTCEIVRGAGDTAARPWRRRWLLFGWGLAVGLGLWSDPLIAPFVACTAFVLALTAWCELRSRRGALALLGLLLGLSPWILYVATSGSAASFLQHAAQASPTTTSATTVEASSPPVVQPSPFADAWDHILGVVVIAIPNNTGATTLCPLDANTAWPPSRWSAPDVSPCIALRAVWGGGWLALLIAALALEVAAFLRHRRAAQQAGDDDAALPPPVYSVPSLEKLRVALARDATRACALAAPLITTLLFGLSSVAASSPWNYSRYLISLLIAVPVALASVWDRASSRSLQSSGSRITRKDTSPAPTSSTVQSLPPLPPARLATAAVTAVLLVALALGVIGVFRSAPAVAAQAAQQQNLIDHLLAEGQTRDYADYWTCLRMIFESDERVICSVLATDLSLAPNRYPPYDALVRAASTHAYVFAVDTPQARDFPAYAAQRGWRYTTETVNSLWVIYIPT